MGISSDNTMKSTPSIIADALALADRLDGLRSFGPERFAELQAAVNTIRSLVSLIPDTNTPVAPLKTPRDEAATSSKASPSPTPSMASLFDGPVRLYDHGHIKAPEHATLFKTGELDLPGQPILVVAVRYSNFAFNAAQKRTDAIFEALDSDGRHIGHYFASAFRTLML